MAHRHTDSATAPKTTARKICHLDLIDFLVTVERKHDPALRDRPVIVGGQPTGWGRVVAASVEAQMCGVRPGLSLAIAASRCPNAVFVDGAFDRYLDASAAIDELIRDSASMGTTGASMGTTGASLGTTGVSIGTTGASRGTSGISLGTAAVSLPAAGASSAEGGAPLEWASVDSVFLDLTEPASRPAGRPGSLGGSGSWMRSPRQVAEHLQQSLRERLGFEASCGIASTKVAAQIASRLAQPTGLLYVLPGYERRFLAALDADLLPDLPPGALDRLKQAGVLTIGHLATLDQSGAEALLGRRASEFLRYARGEDERAVDGTAPPRSVARDLTLPAATQDPRQLESAAQYLTEMLAGRLRRLNCFAQTVTVRVRGGSPERTYARATTLREATAMDAELVTASRALLHTLRRQCQTIASVTIVLSNLQRSGAQMPLFPLAPPATRDRWMNVRTRRGFRALVDGRFLEHGTPTPRRRAG